MQFDSTVEFCELPVNAIQPNDYNPNRMSPGHFKALKGAIQKDGFVGVALVNRTDEQYVIIDGEHRWRAAGELGMETIPCAVTEMSPDRAKAVTIKLNQIHGDWVPDLLADLVTDLPEPLAELGFAEGELDEMLKQVWDPVSLGAFETDIQDRSNPGSQKHSERYVGLNLNRHRRELLDRALELASSENLDHENPRAGSLEVILRSYLAEHGS